MKGVIGNILITGASGFIGRHLVHFLLAKEAVSQIIALDNLQGEGRLINLQEFFSHPRFTFIQEDIRHQKALATILREHNIDHVLHLAAQSHVDYSISDPLATVDDNIISTARLIENCQRYRKTQKKNNFRFIQVSTDEVFGSLSLRQKSFTEESPYQPNSPYASSKAGADLILRSYQKTYGFPAIITYACNNFGSFQALSKFIPRIINAFYLEKEVPIYGNGKQIRDWLAVEDHIAALYLVLTKGIIGEKYAISAQAEYNNLEVAQYLALLASHYTNKPLMHFTALIKHVEDRAGHDFRYGLNSEKITKQLGWQPKIEFLPGLKNTLNWYFHHRDWCN